jgi:hypothetical protein
MHGQRHTGGRGSQNRYPSQHADLRQGGGNFKQYDHQGRMGSGTHSGRGVMYSSCNLPSQYADSRQRVGNLRQYDHQGQIMGSVLITVEM